MTAGKLAIYFACAMCGLHSTESARILAMLPLNFKSHFTFFQPILRTLVGAGHEVVVYSHFPLDNPPPNYVDVYLGDSNSTSLENVSKVLLKLSQLPQWKCIDPYIELSNDAYSDYFENEDVMRLHRSDEKFDLIMVEAFAFQEFTLILGHIFQVPVISLQTPFRYWLIDVNMGNSLTLPYVPDMCSAFSDKMTFLERVSNSFSIVRSMYLYHHVYLPRLENKMRILFPEMPSIKQLIGNVSLVFSNTHVVTDYPRPVTPNIVHVGGIHISKEVDPLPEAIQNFMDRATEGVILFSLGTYVLDEFQPNEYFDSYNRLFRELPQRVLWKTSRNNIQGLPDNVMTAQWLPQQSVLAHPKCVLFITHGGIQSQHEAVHFGVPVVGIPHFSDQHRNIKYFEAHKVGVKVEARDLSENTLLAAIKQVLNNPEYTTNMKRLSRVYKDRPVSPNDNVVFWTEHVATHGGLHLRPASTKLPWYELLLLDVLAVFLSFTFIVAALIYWMYNIIIKLCTYTCTTTTDSKRKKHQ